MQGAKASAQSSPPQSVLAPKKLPVEQHLALKMWLNTLLDFIGAAQQDAAGKCDPFVQVSAESAMLLRVRRVVRRACYDHILPIVKDAMRNKKNCCVTGTPGIGKTLFGLFLLRDIVINDDGTVAYWNSEYAVLFTVDTDVIHRYGLSHTENIKQKQWYIGCWPADEKFLTELLAHNGIDVVHDPKENFIEGGNKGYTKCAAFILPFGHTI